jgi:hypothetical protein
VRVTATLTLSEAQKKFINKKVLRKKFTPKEENGRDNYFIGQYNAAADLLIKKLSLKIYNHFFEKFHLLFNDDCRHRKNE